MKIALDKSLINLNGFKRNYSFTLDMKNRRFFIPTILGFITLLTVIALSWELLPQKYFQDLDYKTIHYLFITRGVIVSLILAMWAMWFIWRGKIKFQEKFANIIQYTPDAVLVYDESGKITVMNKKAANLFCGPEQNKLDTIWDIITPEDKANFSTMLERAKHRSKLPVFEIETVLASGKRIPMNVGLTHVDEDNGMYIESIRDISNIDEFRIKMFEIEKAQVVGKLAEGVAHHMGTPLASMLLRIQMLKEDISGNQDCIYFVDKLRLIEKQIFYSQKVIQGLLKFARRPESEVHSVSVSSLIKEGVEIVRPILKKGNVQLEWESNNDVKVLANVNLLKLVLSDIVMNAVDAMPKGGKISINTFVDNPHGDIVIKITDTGVGIPEHVLPFVFDPFYTTKPAGKGTGLGLSVAKGIIKDHGGEINIESKECVGTSVYIRLLIYSEELELAQV